DRGGPADDPADAGGRVLPPPEPARPRGPLPGAGRGRPAEAGARRLLFGPCPPLRRPAARRRGSPGRSPAAEEWWEMDRVGGERVLLQGRESGSLSRQDAPRPEAYDTTPTSTAIVRAPSRSVISTPFSPMSSTRTPCGSPRTSGGTRPSG